jgi:hypothetical protein
MTVYHHTRVSNSRVVSNRSPSPPPSSPFSICTAPMPGVSDLFRTEIATITYRSGPEWDIRFGRKLRASPESAERRIPALCADFLIETYLDHQVSFSL